MGEKRSRVRLSKEEYKRLCIKILQRDGWRCRVPTCRSRKNSHVHHAKFRSAGGGDEESNLMIVCLDHHEMIHRGELVVLAKSGDIEDEIDTNVGVKFLFVKERKVA